MNDCTNAEIRDLLPDLLHERLDGSARVMVVAHVDGCVDCREELQLLRDVLAVSSSGTPRMDVASIVGALPKAPTPRVANPSPDVIPLVRRRRAWSDWRVAAAVTLMIAGGGSFALMRSGQPAAAGATAPAATQPSLDAGPPVATALPTAATVAEEDHATADVANDSRLGELDEAQLGTLLEDVQNLKALPSVEPEPVTIRVDARVASEGV
jgi:hypothetical protein